VLLPAKCRLKARRGSKFWLSASAAFSRRPRRTGALGRLGPHQVSNGDLKDLEGCKEKDTRFRLSGLDGLGGLVQLVQDPSSMGVKLSPRICAAVRGMLDGGLAAS
jgi:hypothetical protein